jgi:O-antigen/teichoic acid export membrane protein
VLIRNTLIYFVGRGAAGVVSLCALALFTRLLSPEEYGRYALVVAYVGLVNGVAFQWLQLATRRFYIAHADRRADFLNTVRAAYARIAVGALVVGILIFVAWPDVRWRWLLTLGAIVLTAQAWFELTLELSLAGLEPVRYGLLTLVKAMFSLACGGVLAWLGFGAAGILIGLIVGYLIPAVVATLGHWRVASSGRPDAGMMREFLAYGIPLTGTLALAFVVSSTDRLLLGWLRGPADVGRYGVAYDLSFQALTALMMLVNLSGFPLAIRALEIHGLASAREHAARHATLLLAVAAPAAVGLALLAPNVSGVLLGGAFQQGATALLPWLAVAAFVGGLRGFYFDLSFQLGRATLKQMWVGACAAAVNVALNLLWIPSFGVLGAAWASLTAYLVALALSVLLGRRVFPMPVPASDWVKVALASTAMGLALLPFMAWRGQRALAVQVFAGGVVYLVAVILLNVGGTRRLLAQRLQLGGAR